MSRAYYSFLRKGEFMGERISAARLLKCSIEKTDPQAIFLLVGDQPPHLFEEAFLPYRHVEGLSREAEWHIFATETLGELGCPQMVYLELGSILLDSIAPVVHLNNDQRATFYSPDGEGCTLISLRGDQGPVLFHEILQGHRDVGCDSMQNLPGVDRIFPEAIESNVEGVLNSPGEESLMLFADEARWSTDTGLRHMIGVFLTRVRYNSLAELVREIKIA